MVSYKDRSGTPHPRRELTASVSIGIFILTCKQTQDQQMPDSMGGGGGVMTPVSWLLRKSSVSFRIMISAMLCGTQFSALEILESEMLDLGNTPLFSSFMPDAWIWQRTEQIYRLSMASPYNYLHLVIVLMSVTVGERPVNQSVKQKVVSNSTESCGGRKDVSHKSRLPITVGQNNMRMTETRGSKLN